MYKKGDVQTGLLNKHGFVRHYDNEEGETGTPVAYLPHSCDEWIIGDVASIVALIADLQEAITEITRARANNS